MAPDGNMCLTEPIPSKGPSWMLISKITVCVLCLISLTLAAVALGRSNSPQTVLVTSPQQSNQPAAPRKIWTFAMGHDYGAHVYMDKAGYFQGFSPDIVRGVCQASDLDCRLVLDDYNNCWTSSRGTHAVGGVGLMGRWYDACVGWFKTIDRDHVFQFSLPYAKAPEVHFFVKVGSTFNGADVAGKKIGFISGWATDEKCLARQANVKNRILTGENILHAKDPTELADWIMSGKVDAGFASWYTFGGHVQEGKLATVNQPGFKCVLEGNSVMTRKGSPLIPVWNEAFSKFKRSNDFHRLCQEAKTKHGHEGNVFCID